MGVVTVVGGEDGTEGGYGGEVEDAACEDG